MVRPQRNALRNIAKARRLDVNRLQAVAQIFAKSPFLIAVTRFYSVPHLHTSIELSTKSPSVLFQALKVYSTKAIGVVRQARL
jgi:hypothetical protein